MERIRITQIRSRIGATKLQRANLDSLGLRKINQTVEHNASSQILGMVTKVNHLVKVEEVK